MTMDMVSGAEVPEAEITVTPAMVEAGADSCASFPFNVPIQLAEVVTTIYRAMRRAELAEGGR